MYRTISRNVKSFWSFVLHSSVKSLKPKKSSIGIKVLTETFLDTCEYIWRLSKGGGTLHVLITARLFATRVPRGHVASTRRGTAPLSYGNTRYLNDLISGTF